MEKKCNVVMLPTQSKAVRLGQLVIGAGNHLFSSRQSNDIGSLTAYELYITSDEEIKEDDWIFDNYAKINLIQQVRVCDLELVIIDIIIGIKSLLQLILH